MGDQTTKATQAHGFNHADFLKSLQSLPPNLIFEMARDGVICELEIARIFKLMGISNDRIQSLQPHLTSIAKLVLNYAQHDMGVPAPLELCRLTSAQSIVIMEGLLKKNMIQPYFEDAERPRPNRFRERIKTSF